MQQRVATFLEHLDELRTRIIKSLVFFAFCSCLCYIYTPQAFRILIQPVKEVVFIAPGEAFMAHLTLALFGGLAFSSPFILYQIWSFLRSGLKKQEKKYAVIFGGISLVLFILGLSFGYRVVLPLGLNFLLRFGSELLRPMISVSKYIGFVASLEFAFAALFQLPVAVLFLTKIGVVTPAILRSKRKEAVILVFIFAALITPPDVVTQIFLGVPLVLLYEVSIIASKFAVNTKDGS